MEGAIGRVARASQPLTRSGSASSEPTPLAQRPQYGVAAIGGGVWPVQHPIWRILGMLSRSLRRTEIPRSARSGRTNAPLQQPPRSLSCDYTVAALMCRGERPRAWPVDHVYRPSRSNPFHPRITANPQNPKTYWNFRIASFRRPGHFDSIDRPPYLISRQYQLIHCENSQGNGYAIHRLMPVKYVRVTLRKRTKTWSLDKK